MALKTANNGIGAQHDNAYKGLGAALNLEGRFEEWQLASFENGWAEGAEGAISPKTIVTREYAIGIVNTVDSPRIKSIAGQTSI